MAYFIKRHAILSYCVLVLLWSFVWWGLILTVAPIGTLFDPPVQPWAMVCMVLGGIGPSLMAFILTPIIEGPGSGRALLARLKLWRVGWWWLALLIPFALNAVLFALYAMSGAQVSVADVWPKLLPAIFLGLYAGLSEEFGWRGFLLPRLQRRYSPFVSALLVGLVWGGFWHLYADYIGAFGNRGWWGAALTIIQAPILLTAYSVMLTWVYNHTRGSMLLCVLFHAAISSSALLFSVTYPTSEVYLAWATVYSLLAWIAAGALVLVVRRKDANAATSLRPA
ncbi:MAG: type II CAAX endopeptidase family protein [Anaerolineae bacterium]